MIIMWIYVDRDTHKHIYDIFFTPRAHQLLLVSGSVITLFLIISDRTTERGTEIPNHGYLL